MNEIERITQLPVRLKYSLAGPLKDILNVVLAKARLEFEVPGMVRSVADGFQRWNSLLEGMDGDREAAVSAYVRTLAIAIPDLFVVSHDQQAFAGYTLDENEVKVLDDARELFQAKVAFAEMSSRVNNDDLRNLQTSIIKQHPIFQDMKKRESQFLRQRA
jgi:hypothetical protein